jgi:hypothetical protein
MEDNSGWVWEVEEENHEANKIPLEHVIFRFLDPNGAT